MCSETESNVETSGSVEPNMSVCRGLEPDEVQEQQESQGNFGSMCGITCTLYSLPKGHLGLYSRLRSCAGRLDLRLDAFGCGVGFFFLYIVLH